MRTIYILSALCAGVGVASVESSAPSAGVGAIAVRWLGPILLAIAAVAAWWALGRLQSGCRRLVGQIRPGLPALAGALGDSAGHISCPDPALAPLAAAVNTLVESADRAVSQSAVRAKELEIRLKVATAERQHAQAILYSISDAVLVTDPFDEVVLANESAARTFEFDLARVARAPIDSVLRDPKMVQLIRETRLSRSTTARRIVEHQVQTPGGMRTFKVTLSSVADGPEDIAGAGRRYDPAGPGGRPSAGVVAVLHDVTREKEISDMKNDFVSMVSHELRTPLASIRAYIEMLIDREAVDEKTTREFYDVIQNEANRLGRLIDNILNISRIESGLVKADKHPQSLTVIVKEALEVIVPQAAQKNIRLIEDLTPVFYQTEADRDMLYQAVLNLLSNSVKYTPTNGCVTVRTTVNEADRKVVLRIIDNGVGIPPKDLPFVFEKFYRAEANSGMAHGTGLGLSVVKHIIETVHQGRMFVESQVGSGSTFGFELKLSL